MAPLHEALRVEHTNKLSSAARDIYYGHTDKEWAVGPYVSLLPE